MYAPACEKDLSKVLRDKLHIQEEEMETIDSENEMRNAQAGTKKGSHPGVLPAQ